MGHCRDRNFSLASISFIFPASILFSRLSKRHESSRSFVGRTLVHVTKTAAIKKKEKERKNYGRWWKGQTARDFAPRTISMKKARGWSFSSSVFFFYSCVFELKASHKIHTHTHNGKKLQVGDAPRLREAETSSESLRVGEYKRPVC